MNEPILTLEAKQAVRKYILTFFALPAVVLFALGFLFKEAIWQGAYNKAMQESLSEIIQAHKRIEKLLAEIQTAKSEFENKIYNASNAISKATKKTDELRKQINNMDNLAKALKSKSNLADEVSKQLKKDGEFRKRVMSELTQPNIFRLGNVKCSRKSSNLRVPVTGTTTDHWLVFGINQNIRSYTGRRSGDNAIFSFKTTITPNATKDSWSVNYFVEINSASDQNKRLRLSNCPREVKDLQIVAIRVYR